jgi:hypothetical protein
MNPFYPSTIPPPMLDESPYTFFTSPNHQSTKQQTYRHTLIFQAYRPDKPKDCG